LRLKVDVDLSDFKEGECLLLHKEGTTTGIACKLTNFEDDGDLIISVFPLDISFGLESYYDTALILDKNYVDLRENVYDHFLGSIPFNCTEFWERTPFNTKKSPTFEDEDKCNKVLSDTIECCGLKLLPKQREAILKSMSAKDYYLIQGPPGTGKSFVLSWIIIEEIIDLKHKVVVVGPNHMAINNTLEQILKNMPNIYFLLYKVGQSYHAPKLKVKSKEDEDAYITNISRVNTSYFNDLELDLGWVVGLTPHSLYTSRAKGLNFDTLVIDEAGQMSIPLALMGMLKAKKVIFAGDHKQLPPIITSEDIKEELTKSAFESLIKEDNSTMLDVSFRMCEPICDYVSELFYDGKIHSYKKGCGNKIICEDSLYSFDSPIVIHNVEDNGEQVSNKEAEFISEVIGDFISKGLLPEDVGVLSPFRAQAANIRRYINKSEYIKEENKKSICSETIDKMQGQEREVIIYSLTSGDIEYMTDMSDFLYNPNKMNVAFSRAKSKLIIVGNIERLKRIDLSLFPHIRKMITSKLVKFV